MRNSRGKPRLVRQVTIKIFAPENRGFHKQIILAGNGRTFTEEGIQKLLEAKAEEIEKRMPGHEYRLVELADKASFNFVWVGKTEERMRAEDAATDLCAALGPSASA
jgi:hypothetical protein